MYHLSFFLHLFIAFIFSDLCDFWSPFNLSKKRFSCFVIVCSVALVFTIRYSRSHLAPFLCVCFICVCVYHHPRLADLVITHISSLTTVLHSQGLNRCSGMVTFMYPPASETPSDWQIWRSLNPCLTHLLFPQPQPAIVEFSHTLNQQQWSSWMVAYITCPMWEEPSDW